MSLKLDGESCAFVECNHQLLGVLEGVQRVRRKAGAIAIAAATVDCIHDGGVRARSSVVRADVAGGD